MHVLRLRNRNVAGSRNQDAAIPLEAARICTVCWTVHQADECPECKARQWRSLLDLLRVLGLEPWAGADIRITGQGVEAELVAL